MYLVTCPHTKPTQKLTPPRGHKKAPTHLPVCPFDCQYTTMPDLDESESWTTVNKLRVRECREGTVCGRVSEWLTSIGHPHSGGLNTNTHILSTLHSCLPLRSLLSYKTSRLSPVKIHSVHSSFFRIIPLALIFLFSSSSISPITVFKNKKVFLSQIPIY